MMHATSFFAMMMMMVVVMVTLTAAAPINSLDLEKRGSKFTGTGTWFLPATEGGSTGACGPKEGNNSPIVALNAPQYGNLNGKSTHCGKKIRITGPKGSVTATINDACPECKHGDLDLTPVLFKKVIGDMNIGVGKISWQFV